MAAAGGAESEFEEALLERAKREAGPLVQQLTQQLSSALVYSDATNIDTNRKLWDLYASEWSQDTEWVRRMMSHVDSEGVAPTHVGDEWSDVASLEKVLGDYVAPHLSPESVVAEIGSGGGRLAHRIAPRCSTYTCFDISMEMLKRARGALAHIPGAKFVHMRGPQVDPKWHGTFDFVVCFDVMVHMDLHTIYQYLGLIRSMLKPKGQALISTANLLTPLGWKRFAAQQRYTVGGFYFISPDIVRKLVGEAGLQIISESTPGDEECMYYNRDAVMLVCANP